MLTPLAFLILAASAIATPSDGPTRAEAAALADPKLDAGAVASAAADDGALILRAWRQRPGTWVAMIPDVSEPDGGKQTAILHLAVLARNGQRWTAIARADQARTDEDLGLANSSLTYDLDLAPFRLNETEVAFGVREHAEILSPTRPGASEMLLLYRVVGARLVRVLSVNSRFEWTDEDGAGTGTERSTVAVSKHKTGGFFDLVVTSQSDLPRPEKTVTTYAWAGAAYQEVERPKASKASKKPSR
jgi:hypothetical protein